MRQTRLNEIIEMAFAKISCPLDGNGVYNEIKKAILEAYTLGRFKDDDNILTQLANQGSEPNMDS
jgi:hypothetical protein